MSQPPAWLPPCIPVSPWTGDTFDTLYKVFSRDFKESQPTYDGNTVWYFPEIDDGKERIFWHLTHRDDEKKGNRLPDLERAKRLSWVRAILDNHNAPEVLTWDYEEDDKSIHTYVWLKEQNFVVIMKKYRDGRRRLKTSYFVNYSHKRQSLEKKYTNRVKTK